MNFNKITLPKGKKILKVSFICLILPLVHLLPHLKQVLSPYDTGLYHKHIVEIIKNEFLIIGSANLHDRLGFNNSNFYLVALWEKIFPEFSSYYVLNPFVYFLAISYLMYIILIKGRNYYESKIIALGCLLSISIYPLFIVSISPDTISYCLGIIFILSFFEKKSKAKIWNQVIIYSLLITVKFSSVFLGILFLPFLIESIKLKRIYYYIFIFLIILSPWIVLNYYISGYLIYPVLQLSFLNPEWKLPESMGMNHILMIKNWALTQGKITIPINSFFDYMNSWYKIYSENDINNSYFLISLYTFSLPMIIIYGIIKAIKRDFSNKDFFLLALFIINIIWFVTAPDPRFNYSTLLIFPLILISRTIVELLPSYSLNFKLNKIFSVLLILITIGFTLLRIKDIDFKFLEKVNQKNNIVLGKFETSKYGMVYFRPDTEQCWDIYIYCNPYGIQNLRLVEGYFKKIVIGYNGSSN